MATQKTLLTALAAATMGLGAQAGVVTDTVAYDNSQGDNAGGQVSGPPTFLMTGSATDGDTGVSFTYELTVTALGDGSPELRTNGGTDNREWGVRTTNGQNGAIENVDNEGIQYTVGNITVTDFAGNDPGDVSVTFDQFTSVILNFVANPGDAGEVSDGVTTFWSFSGAIYDSGANGSDASDDGGLLGNTSDDSKVIGTSVAGFSSAVGTNILLDLSSYGMTTFQALGADGGDGSTNRWRVDDITSQFTVNVVPEPGSLTLLALGGLALCGRRRRNA